MLGKQRCILCLLRPHRGPQGRRRRRRLYQREIPVRGEPREELGGAGVLVLFSSIIHPSYQIDYFNKRRVLAEQQKDLLTQARSQAEATKRK